jgi:phosphoribosyl-dephospho-CoA transferase
LREKTTIPLKTKFSPIVKEAIEKVNVTSYWSPLVNAYNIIPGGTRQNPNLEDYITGKAIDGLMTLIAEQEMKIRQDPAAQVTALLKKVFGKK